MLVDRYQGTHSTASGGAVAAFEQAVFAVAAHRPALKPLKSALEQDPDLVAALALKGLGVALLGKAEDLTAGRTALAVARAAEQRKGGGTAFEETLIAALEQAVEGRFKAAALLLEAYLERQPQAFLCLKLANALRFMTGETGRMREITSRVLPAWHRNDAGYGFVLGMHAFGLEETGAFAEAETAGLQAVTAERADIWGVHAVSHVMEMRGRAEEGARWLELSRDLWPLCNNFGFHLAWHLALFRLENAEYDAVLDLYDQEIRPTETDDFRDMANAVSMLWRLQQEGVDVGTRWRSVHEIAYKRRTDTTYVFASLHYLLALLGAGDHQAARELVESLRLRAQNGGTDDQAQVAAEVGYAAARLISARHGSDSAITGLADVALKLPSIGGSRAQRDVFLRTLMLEAVEAGDPSLYQRILQERRALKSVDRFDTLCTSRLTGLFPDGSSAQAPLKRYHA